MPGVCAVSARPNGELHDTTRCLASARSTLRDVNAGADEEYAQLVADSWQAFHEDAPDLGSRHARQAIALAPEDGRAWYALACNLERAGSLIAADQAFRRAAGCDHEPHPAPFRVAWRHFETAVARAAEDLPEQLQSALGEIELVLSDYPGGEVADQERTYEMLGLFSGTTKAEGAAAGAAGGDLEIPPRIHLYRRAHEHIAPSTDEFAREVRRTLYHELGHYLGFDEDDMQRFGLE